EAFPGASTAWAAAGIALVVTLVFTELSFRWVEQPVRRLGFRGAIAALRQALGGTAGEPRRRTRAVASGIAVLGVVALTAGTVAGIAADPGSGTVQQQIEAGQKAIADA